MDASLPSPQSYHIGTVGFSYPGWQTHFYPGCVKTADYLAAYASAFDAVELDTTFYGTPPVARVEGWTQAVPEKFYFCPKTPRQITHDTPLQNALPQMLAFLEALAPMRAAKKLGPILIQFPGFFTQANHGKLDHFLRQLPTHSRYAIEFRDRSWLRPSTAELLAAHRCAWVAADYSQTPWPIQHTTDFLYLRFVGKRDRFSGDGPEQIDTTPQLNERLAEVSRLKNISVSTPVFALFANDYAGHAPATANRFRRLVGLPHVTAIRQERPAAQQSLF